MVKTDEIKQMYLDLMERALKKQKRTYTIFFGNVD